jgi:hypothetical protein
MRIAGPAKTLRTTPRIEVRVEFGSTPNRIGWPDTSWTKLDSTPANTKPTAVRYA